MIFCCFSFSFQQNNLLSISEQKNMFLYGLDLGRHDNSKSRPLLKAVVGNLLMIQMFFYALVLTFKANER